MSLREMLFIWRCLGSGGMRRMRMVESNADIKHAIDHDLLSSRDAEQITKFVHGKGVFPVPQKPANG